MRWRVEYGLTDEATDRDNAWRKRHSVTADGKFLLPWPYGHTFTIETTEPPVISGPLAIFTTPLGALCVRIVLTDEQRAALVHAPVALWRIIPAADLTRVTWKETP